MPAVPISSRFEDFKLESKASEHWYSECGVPNKGNKKQLSEAKENLRSGNEQKKKPRKKKKSRKKMSAIANQDSHAQRQQRHGCRCQTVATATSSYECFVFFFLLAAPTTSSSCPSATATHGISSQRPRDSQLRFVPVRIIV